MTPDEVAKLDHGLYRIYWTEEEGGDASIAAVGSLYDGTRWFAPTNWTSQREQGIASTKWEMVSHVEPLSYDW